MTEPDMFALMMGNLARQAQQLGAQITEQTRPVTWEYKLVPWDDVNPLARDGWELKAMDVGALRFVMGRPRGAADEAADMLKAAAVCWECGHGVSQHDEAGHWGCKAPSCACVLRAAQAIDRNVQ